MKNKFFSIFDYFLIILVLSLVGIGVCFIYSSSINSDGVSVTREYYKQMIWAGVGFVLMIIVAVYDYRKTNTSLSTYLYFIMIAILIYTLIFGKNVNNAKSWIGIGGVGIQPSEFCKIIYIVYLAKYLFNSKMENQLIRFSKATLIMLIPMGLVLIQPDLGTATVYIPILLIMCFFAGIPLRYILYMLSFGCLSILFAVMPVINNVIYHGSLKFVSILSVGKLRAVLLLTSSLICLLAVIVARFFHIKKSSYWILYIFSIISLALICSLVLGKVLKPYQIQRLIVFINPDVDPLDTGWNIIQSKIAIGAGGLFGRGFLNGTQSHYRFLPQQSTDFIFSILSEEWGFLGGLLIFGIYFLILIRILIIMKQCTSEFGVYIASGILAMFGYHFFVNVGMVMGITPCTGIPLFFVSYGGSSLLTAMVSIGVLMSINYRKKELA
ncbi:MAG: rod shape-determining protein RodA [Treponema sp.]|nr:rod shape-determining protein RodA [Treponema sp.]